jgi:hypothetical protein
MPGGRLLAGTFRADQIQTDPTEYLRTADTSGAPTILVLPGSQQGQGQGSGGVTGAQAVVLYHDSAGDGDWWNKLIEACQSGAMIEANFAIKS